MAATGEKTIESFEHIVNGAFDYEEALRRQNIKHSDVVVLREKIKRSKLIPQFIHDKQVSGLEPTEALVFKPINRIAFAVCQRVQRRHRQERQMASHLLQDEEKLAGILPKPRRLLR